MSFGVIQFYARELVNGVILLSFTIFPAVVIYYYWRKSWLRGKKASIAKLFGVALIGVFVSALAAFSLGWLVAGGSDYLAYRFFGSNPNNLELQQLINDVQEVTATTLTATLILSFWSTLLAFFVCIYLKWKEKRRKHNI